LKDKRDALLLDLTKKIEVRAYTDGNGQLVVQGPGVTLLQGSTKRELALDIADDGSLRVFARSNSGGAGGDVTSHLSGGELAGIIEVRDHDVVAMQTELDQFAFNVGTQLNAVHAAGFGLDGQNGRALLEVGTTAQGAAGLIRVSDDVAGQPDLLGAASSAAALPGDGTQAMLLASVADEPVPGLDGLNPSEAYGRLVGNVGRRKQEAAETLSLREAMTAQVETMRQSVSGVSLDEEMVALTQYQRAFEAASRVFTTADQLLETLINTLGR
jgi:flagellar hook-associated protein 1 FlgK